MIYGKVSICEIMGFVRILRKEQYPRGLLAKNSQNLIVSEIFKPSYSLMTPYNPSKFDLGVNA